MDPYLRALGNRIRELRRDRKLSQEGLASLAGLTPKYVSQLETARANPSILVLKAISEALGLSLAALFNFDLGRDSARALTREVTGLLSTAPEHERKKAVAVLRAMLSQEAKSVKDGGK